MTQFMEQIDLNGSMMFEVPASSIDLAQDTYLTRIDNKER